MQSKTKSSVRSKVQKMLSSAPSFFDDVRYTAQANKGLFLVVFLLVIAAISCYVKDDNDAYFLYENGRRILESGFPYQDWISMHDGLDIVLQQWAVSVIDFLVWNAFGDLGSQVLASCELFVIGCLLMYLCYRRSGDLFISFLLVMIPLSTIVVYTGNIRPQLWTLIFTLTALILLGEWTKTGEARFIIPFIAVSWLQANFHATFWTAVLGIYVVYGVLNCRRDRKRTLVTVIVGVASITVALINPYGVKALISPYMTIGHYGYSMIGELMPPDMQSYWIYYIIPVALLVAMMVRKFVVKREKKAFSAFPADIFLFAIVLVYSSFVLRTVIFFEVLWAVCLADLVIDRDVDLAEYKVRMDPVRWVLYLLVVAFLVFIAAFQAYKSHEEFYERRPMLIAMQEAVDFLEEHDESIEGKTVASSEIGFGNFAYNKLGIRPYMDGRFENYIIQFNHKKDYFEEMLSLTQLQEDDDRSIRERCEDFVNEYDFDYLVLYENSALQVVMESFDGYELVHKTSKDESGGSFYIYERLNN